MAVIFVLSGCTSANDVRRAVVVEPEGIHSYAAMCSAPVSEMSPEGYVYAGWDYVDEQCSAFFDNLILLSKDARYASSSIATANSQATLILQAVEASATSIAIVAAGTELARQLINGFAAEYAFSPYSVEVRRLVFAAMSAYRTDSETGSALDALTTARFSGDAYCLATNIVRNYAKLCTISGVEALARQAVANSYVQRVRPVAPYSSRFRALSAPAAAGPRRRRATDAEIATFRRGLGLPNYMAGSPQ
jgi:hypothetical protein